MSLTKTMALCAVAGAALLCASSFASAQQERVAAPERGLCRRPPTAIVLPPEPPERQAYQGRPSRRGGAIPPPPSPSPPSSVAMESSAEEVVVTGTRIEGRSSDSAAAMARVVAPDTEAPRGSAFEYRERQQPTPRAGLLTAGDHDDLLNPQLYAAYADAFLARETLAGVPRVDTRQALTILVQDRAGRGVPFADVTITCADGNRLSLATTANGEAVFFPELDRLGTRVTVSARHEGRPVAEARSVTIGANARAQEVRFMSTSAGRRVRNFDLALVVDTTGSMGDELEYLKTELSAILDPIRAENPGLNVRVALIVYRDTTDQYITRTFPFTNDISALRGNLAQQSAGGGGDYPEAVEQAMARAVALDWRPNAVRSILLVADAPPHADDVAATWRSAEVARGRRIQIVPVGASGVGPGAEYMMRAMSALTQSRYIFLTDDSGIGNPHAPPSVDCYNVTSLQTSIERILSSQISGQREEPREQEIIRTVGQYDRGRCRT